MRRLVSIAALVCSIFAVSVQACLWDRDTLAMEARGLPGITEIITGRFDRFPALYYEMRLQRVSEQLEKYPSNLELYDDAGVACDRLSLSDQAIGWMERKLSVLEGLETEGVDTSEHRYRYLANLGTFHVHRWLKNGADRENMADMERSRELIAAAIELNPDAHFGRERYQLLAIEWILNPPQGDGEGRTILHMVPGYRLYQTGTSNHVIEALGYADSVEGLSGLIALGNAWQSPDVYTALAFALADREHHVLATLSMIRVEELKLHARGKELPEHLYDDDIFTPGRAMILDDYTEKLRDFYVRATSEASNRVEKRNSYLLDRLEDGVHPDTDPTFWDDWIESSEPPQMPSLSMSEHNPFAMAWSIVVGVPLVALCLVSVLIWRFRKA
jgi:hypothetical protein